MRERLKAEVIEEILRRRRAGQSHTRIAKEMGLSKKTPRKYCVLYGVDSPEAICKRKTPEEVAEIVDLYLNKGQTPSDIAFQTGIHRTTILSILNREGVRKPRYHRANSELDKPMPPLEVHNEPIYYPERTLTKEVVTIGSKKYQDVSSLFGL